MAISVEAEPSYERIRPPTEAERQVADLLPIEADSRQVQATLDRVPLWFHTFSLDGRAYTPGIARDHRYRVPILPDDFSGRRVLDVGTFDGFYAFLAEARGADRVVAIDNEQYVDWVRSRFGIAARGRRRVPGDRRAAPLERRLYATRRRTTSMRSGRSSI